MVREMKAITETTLLPISLVIVVIGGIVWLTSLYAKTDESFKAIARLESSQDAYYRNLQEISTRLSRIEGKLGINTNR